MVKVYKLHKFFGLSAGLILLILGLSGFFLDHDKWNFMYTTTFTNVPDSTKKLENKLFDSYWIDPNDATHRIVGGKRGIFESFDMAKSFTRTSTLQCMAIKVDVSGTYAATSDGIYKLIGSTWKPLALNGDYITSISLSKNIIVAIIDKHELVRIQKDTGVVLGRSIVTIDASKLQEPIKLSRLVRDVHYGRGLFDGDVSLLINDYGAIIISFLAISGYFIYWLIYYKKSPKISRKLINLHSNWFVILALLPLTLLSITGVFLDHSKSLANFMKSVTIPNNVLPPVYTSLKHDIWSVDFDGQTYRIGNRYGIYKSKDLIEWDLENRGLAFRMIRTEGKLYVSGMGAPNRVHEEDWKVLPKTPHMFRDVMKLNGKIEYFSHYNTSMPVPKFESATLYSLLLSLHDGTFFSSWWVWVNDFASFSLLLLGVTGSYRWSKKRTS